MAIETGLLTPDQLDSVRLLEDANTRLENSGFIDSEGRAFFDEELATLAEQMVSNLVSTLRGEGSVTSNYVGSTRAYASSALHQEVAFTFLDGVLAGYTGTAQFNNEQEQMERGRTVAPRLHAIHSGIAITHQLASFDRLVRPTAVSGAPVWKDVEREFDTMRRHGRKSRNDLSDQELSQLTEWSGMATDTLRGILTHEDRERLRNIKWSGSNLRNVFKFLKFIRGTQTAHIYSMDELLGAHDIAESMAMQFDDMADRIPIVGIDERQRAQASYLLGKVCAKLAVVTSDGWGGTVDTSLFDTFMRNLTVTDAGSSMAVFDRNTQRVVNAIRKGFLS